MEKFNYDSYMRNNPLMKETSGYGNYIPGEKMLENDDEKRSFLPSPDEFEDYIQSVKDKNSDSKKSGKLTPHGASLGSDEEVLETEGNAKVDKFIEKIRELTQQLSKSLNDKDIEYLKTKLKNWADSGFQAPSL